MPGVEGHFLAPSFVDNPRLNGTDRTAILTLLHGLTGDLDGKQYEGLMAAMGTNSNEWIADITTYIRNSFGNKNKLTTPASVSVLRKDFKSRTEPWTQAEFEDLDPPLLDRSKWKMAASHNKRSAKYAIDGKSNTRFTTRHKQQPGMWLRADLSKPARIKGIIIDTGRSKSDYAREFTIVASQDGKTWTKPLVTDIGRSGKNEWIFPETEARYLKIEQTGATDRLFWSIHDLEIIGKHIR